MALFSQFFIIVPYVIVKIIFRNKVMHGNWYGDNTICKALLDINLISRYADKNGVLRNVPQRRILSITDMITPWQGNGSISPSLNRLGMLLIGEDLGYIYAICANIMGFDRNKVHGLTYLMNNNKLSCEGVKMLSSNELKYNNRYFDDLIPDEDWIFETEKNCVGHIEENYLQDKNKKKILYIGNFFFPFDNAAGNRVYANGKVLRELGYDVIYIGMDKKIGTSDSLKTTKNSYDGFCYYNFAYPKRNIDWLNYKKDFESLIQLLKEDQILEDLELVIYYGTPRVSLFIIKLIHYCRNRNIKVVSDCVDWLAAKTQNPLFNLFKWANTTYEMIFVNKRADGILAISSFLASYYEAKGCKTVVIPPLSFYDQTTLIPRIQDNKIVITYAGLPFRLGQRITDRRILKDRIDKMIVLLYEAKRRGCKFILHIYGFTKADYLFAIPSQKKYLDKLGTSIAFHGYIANEAVMEHVRNSDFTILIRDVKRDTMAGFPTKISESISCGTPVITTRTSDLKYYIIKEMNGFFLDINEKRKAVDELVKILKLDRKEIDRMKKNCIQSQMFYYKNYINQMKEFLDEVMN